MSQTVEEYPTTVMTHQPSDQSSQSNGSFGPVFAVLAVIVVISAVACVVGRLCSRRHHRAKEGKKPPAVAGKGGKPSQGLGPKQWESRQKPSFDMSDGDIEFGFDFKKKNSGKAAKSGGGGKPMQPPTNGHHGGGRRPEMEFADNV